MCFATAMISDSTFLLAAVPNQIFGLTSNIFFSLYIKIKERNISLRISNVIYYTKNIKKRKLLPRKDTTTPNTTCINGLLKSRTLLFLEDSVNKRSEVGHSVVTAAAPPTSAAAPPTSAANVITKFSFQV